MYYTNIIYAVMSVAIFDFKNVQLFIRLTQPMSVIDLNKYYNTDTDIKCIFLERLTILESYLLLIKNF